MSFAASCLGKFSRPMDIASPPMLVPTTSAGAVHNCLHCHPMMEQALDFRDQLLSKADVAFDLAGTDAAQGNIRLHAHNLVMSSEGSALTFSFMSHSYLAPRIAWIGL